MADSECNQNASGFCSETEGNTTTASGFASHAEGYQTTASALAAHAEGYQSNASMDSAHAEGSHTLASGAASHAEGYMTLATIDAAHAEGAYTTASGYGSHAEGYLCVATGEASHVEGYLSQASGFISHAEGNSTADEYAAHSEGSGARASGVGSHAEGGTTKAFGNFSHAEGGVTTVQSDHPFSHIMGYAGQTLYPISWHLANGLEASCPGLAAVLQGSTCNLYIDGTVMSPAADYAEMFETLDGQPIEPGYFVTTVGEKIRKATNRDDYVAGIVSARPSFIGGASPLNWIGKYETDEWGKIQY
ncbi:peptidase G2-like protein [Paenibacillus pabuli]|uniref:Peptidase G2-like protein n=1 Tax=Paenibacillus pabuli TaxID=1472 RepID=A0A855Y0N5_9BACL|nr:peptidase G2-like protein [Paenibacillus pabuli]PXW09804.1 peptidase G2-like protein [Paenibacillus taichungensis]